jgi:hypothetical protein
MSPEVDCVFGACEAMLVGERDEARGIAQLLDAQDPLVALLTQARLLVDARDDLVANFDQLLAQSRESESRQEDTNEAGGKPAESERLRDTARARHVAPDE